ncbi:MAG: membrane protein insertion efficiency factor YidD [Rubrivivax sp.]|nr:membrane protein insertion efficiency factor YidD [Rubrivivax sp.]
MAFDPRRWPRQLLIAMVQGYRLLLKPWLGNACRFEPTCSAYALQALEQHGAMRGSALVAGRILRCHPWCDGGLDPVPQDFPNPAAGLFTRLGLGGKAADPRPPTRKHP